MKKILIAYASNSGSTYLVGQIIARIIGRKYSVVVKKAVETKPEEFRKYDLVILGTPSWSVEGHEGYPQETMLALLRGCVLGDVLKTTFALFGCGDTSYTYFCGAVDFLESWVKENQGQQATPSLRVDGYFFDLVRNESLVEKWAQNLLRVLT